MMAAVNENKCRGAVPRLLLFCRIQLRHDECLHIVGIEFEQGGGVGDAGLDVVVDFEGHFREQLARVPRVI